MGEPKYYRGQRVPSCFGGWEDNDLNCESCAKEGLCIKAQEESNAVSAPPRSYPTKPVSVSSYPGSPQKSTALASSKSHLPKEGESAMSRLGKNIVGRTISAAGEELMEFFHPNRGWRIP
jgi:hypothetical protein